MARRADDGPRALRRDSETFSDLGRSLSWQHPIVCRRAQHGCEALLVVQAVAATQPTPVPQPQTQLQPRVAISQLDCTLPTAKRLAPDVGGAEMTRGWMMQRVAVRFRTLSVATRE